MKPRGAEAILLIGTLLPACHHEEQQRPADLKSVSACMAAQHSHDDYLLVTDCVPLGRQKTFTGTWFIGFEMSLFRKDYSGIPADVGPLASQYQMIARPSSEEPLHKYSEAPVAYQVTFQGRESLAPWMPGAGLIVMDRLVMLRPVPITSALSEPAS